MNDQSTCYLLDGGQHMVITYAELRILQQTDAAFRRRHFWKVDDSLIEVSGNKYRELRRDSRHRAYLYDFERDAEIVPFTDDYSTPLPVRFEDDILDKLLQETALQALSSLPTDDEALIRGIYLEGRTERDLAEQLGISCGAVNKRKAKILQQLRKLLGEIQ